MLTNAIKEANKTFTEMCNNMPSGKSTSHYNLLQQLGMSLGYKVHFVKNRDVFKNAINVDADAITTGTDIFLSNEPDTVVCLCSLFHEIGHCRMHYCEHNTPEYMAECEADRFACEIIGKMFPEHIDIINEPSLANLTGYAEFS